MRKVWICSIRVGGCLVLAAVCGMLAVPDDALAKKPSGPKLDCGQCFDGGACFKKTVCGPIWAVPDAAECHPRAGFMNLGDFLIGLNLGCFTENDLPLTGRILAVSEGKGKLAGRIVGSIFFNAPDLNGRLINYRLEMTGDLADGVFPIENEGERAVIHFTDWELSHDTKGAKGACKASGEFPVGDPVIVVLKHLGSSLPFWDGGVIPAACQPFDDATGGLSLGDADHDGVGDDVDSCPDVPNPRRGEQQNDDACACALDGNECPQLALDGVTSVPGVCGNFPADDSDCDGIPDDIDNCPFDADPYCSY